MRQLKWHDYMIYVLKYLSDGKLHERWEIKENVAKMANLSKELMSETVSSGTPVYSDRIGWALTYLKQSGLIDSPARAVFEITNEGRKLLATGIKEVTIKDLEKYDMYIKFTYRRRTGGETAKETTVDDSRTPEENLDSALQEIKDSVCSELLDKIRKVRPSTFETLVIELIKKMGYGDANDPMSGIRVGGAGDGGIDGIIKQDKLGLELIYIQAKRYKENNNVDPHDVRDFIGTLTINGVRRGIFITSSDFSSQAIKHTQEAKDCKVVLINGKRLAELMYEYGIGVTTKQIVEIKKIDGDAFEDEM